MKLLFRIDEYLPETQQIVVRICKSLSREPISAHNPSAIDLKNLDLYDCDTFVESIMRLCGDKAIRKDEEKFEIELPYNKSERISGELNIAELVGKNIEADSENYRRSILKMREVKL
tara:strand:+ start:23 stop:373 length:351 start_codon:yes stop_codon:yes gene_type:complete